MNIPFVISTNISFCMKIMRMLFLRIRNIWFFLFFCYKLNLFVVLWNKPFIFQEECPLSWKRGNMHANKYFSKHQFTNTFKAIYTFDQNCTLEKKTKQYTWLTYWAPTLIINREKGAPIYVYSLWINWMSHLFTSSLQIDFLFKWQTHMDQANKRQSR